MNLLKKYHLPVGGRIVKTGLAVFITAFICHLLNWPAMFAVITAIVTIEPTVADSIRKASKRFPAAAIGAGFAVIFTFLFDESPFTYAFVSFFTIIACHKFKLHDGMIVATLTGVAMITTVHDHFVISFLIRLGTTSVGIIVSTLVNLLVLPPDYSVTINERIHTHYHKIGSILIQLGDVLSEGKVSKKLETEFDFLLKEIDKTEILWRYQKDNRKFQQFNHDKMKVFHYEYKKLTLLRQIIFHIGNLTFLMHSNTRPLINHVQICKVMKAFNSFFTDYSVINKDEYQSLIKIMKESFLELAHSEEIDSSENFQIGGLSPQTAVLFEILSIHDLLVNLRKMGMLEKRK